MRALLQRVKKAQVEVDAETVALIGPGLLVLLCAMEGDTQKQVQALAGKIAKMRIFADEAGKMNRSLLDVSGECLVVSQFTLAADTKKGNRPSYTQACAPETALELCNCFATCMEEMQVTTRTGSFGSDMQVELVNDGPVTIWLDTA